MVSHAGPRTLHIDFGVHHATKMTDVEGLAERLPLRTRIEGTLKQGPMTYAAIAEELGAKVDSVQRTIKRHSDQFTVLSGQPDVIQRIALKSLRVA